MNWMSASDCSCVFKHNNFRVVALVVCLLNICSIFYTYKVTVLLYKNLFACLQGYYVSFMTFSFHHSMHVFMLKLLFEK